MMRHEKEAPLPKSVIPIPEVANPSSINLAAAFRDYRSWATWLAGELEKARPSRKFAALPPIDSVVPFLVSSILYGGLWSEQSLVTLLRTIPDLLSAMTATREAIYIGLALSWHNLPLGEFCSWQPDPPYCNFAFPYRPIRGRETASTPSHEQNREAVRRGNPREGEGAVPEPRLRCTGTFEAEKTSDMHTEYRGKLHVGGDRPLC